MDQSSRAPISILIVDDHPVVRAGLTSMLGTCTQLSIAGSATNGREALQFLDLHPVDVMLLDLRMPAMSGIDTLLSLKTHKFAPRTIVLTTYEMDEDVFKAVQAGALGYLLKDTCLSEMVEAIEVVQSGNVICHAISHRA
ncbi:MAG: response regulator transcription factor [Acidobacteriota bacterium]|nr:response regulator transcription factor [Acidobacteriota bacterium]